MDHPFSYIGCFVDFAEFQAAIRDIRRDPLENDIQNPHVTFAYQPETVDRALFGAQIRLKITGYGNDGINEGLRVQLQTDDPVLGQMIGEIEVPHITIAVSSDGKAVNTRALDFADIDPFEMEGKFGGYAKWGEVIVSQCD